jgi:hypothetical protein
MGWGGTGKPVVLYRGVLSAAAGTGQSSAPGNGATVTLWSSNLANPGAGSFYPPMPLKRFGLTILSSHDSAANGVIVEESEDGSVWDSISAIFPQVYTAANGRQFWDIKKTAAHIRFRYINSANPLAKWQASIEGLVDEAASF